MEEIEEKNECRVCGSPRGETFLSLGRQPLANSFLDEDSLEKEEKEFPLNVFFCGKCGLSQLTHVVNKETLFRDYIYFSSGMPKLSDHFKEYAEDTINRFLEKDDLVVEIASNDGVLLKFYKDQGYEVLGIDPAINVVRKAEDLGVETLKDFFSFGLAEEIVKNRGKAKLVLANNVVAHIDDVRDLARGVSALIGEDGVFVLEAPYILDMFENLAYDTIYHEHLSYLSVSPLVYLFDQFDLEIFDIQVHPIQGQSLRVFVSKKGSREVGESVQKYLDLEKKMNFGELESYRVLADRINNSKKRLLEILYRLKENNVSIAAYGAPAKGNTLLSYCSIGKELVDYALDDLPSKQGLYTPGTHIPVYGRKNKEAFVPDYYLLLAWNYEKVILEKERAYREAGGKFIVPIGDEIRIL